VPRGRGFVCPGRTFISGSESQPLLSPQHPSLAALIFARGHPLPPDYMDPVSSRDNLFSRGPSPPPQFQQFQGPAPSQPNDTLVSSPQSVREGVPATHNTIESLFQNLTASAAPQVSPQPPNVPSSIYAAPPDVPHSGPATPASVNAGSVSSSHSAPSNPAADRQNALLSLLGAVASPPSNVQQMGPSIAPMIPQQVPTPPGSVPRAGPTGNESQTKFLLDQLMSG
jgi:hypothetical protein